MVMPMDPDKILRVPPPPDDVSIKKHCTEEGAIMPTDIVSRQVIDRMLRNLLSVREELERIDLEPSHASNNIPIYIVCRERMRIVQEDMRDLRTALLIDDQLTAMGVL